MATIPTAHIGKVTWHNTQGTLYAALASTPSQSIVLLAEPAPELLAASMEGLMPEPFEPDTEPRAMEVSVVRPSPALVKRWQRAYVDGWREIAVRRVAVEVRRYREAFGVLPRGIATGERPGWETLPSGEDVHRPPRFYYANPVALRRWVHAHFEASPVASPREAARASTPRSGLPVAHSATDLWAFGVHEGATPMALRCYQQESGRWVPQFFGKRVRWVDFPGVAETREKELAEAAEVKARIAETQAVEQAARDREVRARLVAMFGEPEGSADP